VLKNLYKKEKFWFKSFLGSTKFGYKKFRHKIEKKIWVINIYGPQKICVSFFFMSKEFGSNKILVVANV